jgi:hypothetical protein
VGEGDDDEELGEGDWERDWLVRHMRRYCSDGNLLYLMDSVSLDIG